MSVSRYRFLRAVLLGGSAALTIAPAFAEEPLSFNIAQGDLKAALDCYTRQTGVQLIYPADRIAGIHTQGVHGKMIADVALDRLLKGTNFAEQVDPSGAIAIVDRPHPVQVAQAAPHPAAPATIETVVVTAQKKAENIQTVPIAVTALSQQQLTERQIAGGPDLVKEVPNLAFTKTNFSGYDIQIRGIGTQAISVTTDPAVAVAFNDIPFIRNHFFEQEFYDLQDVEVLRGPQGTLYGRNATAGVVDLKSAPPTDQYEAMMSADLGNYNNRRLEGMLNLPIVGDQLDIRIAGEWTKRDGYTEDTTAGVNVDGRDLWSSRVTIGWKPASNFQAYLIWEHFSEDDDRLRSGKQLCETDWGPGGSASDPGGSVNGFGKPFATGQFIEGNAGDFFSQGCKPTSLYSPSAFEEPVAFVLPYVTGGEFIGGLTTVNPYPSETQSTNLRQIQEDVLPQYKAKNDTLELNSTYQIAPHLNLVSQTGYNNDSLWSFEDYNRFESVPGVFSTPFCDPQLGCSTKLLIDDLSDEHAWQASQEFRLASSFDGPFNFSVGANYLHYETVENYYVFSNAFTAIQEDCGPSGYTASCNGPISPTYNNLSYPHAIGIGGGYTDPNPLSSLNNEGHNYFLSQNPYVLNSYAMFGEAYYNLTNDLKFTGGLRWTDDQKHFVEIPSWLAESGYGYPVAGELNQQWDQWTGRSVLNWTPQTDFTDQTMVYGSYSHGYKAGGANPPGALFTVSTEDAFAPPVEPDHPLTFKPEFIDAYEIGSKNTLLDGSLTLNGDIFFYDYKNYQISEIVDRTAINNNYNATADGAELETTWEPMPGLKFSFTGGYENTRINNGQYAVDLMDRTAGMPGWYVVKPYLNEASNCIFPGYVAQWIDSGTPDVGAKATSYCELAYLDHLDPLTRAPYVANPTVNAFGNPLTTYDGTAIVGYPGFNPLTAPNDGEGFAKPLGGNQLPNAPHFTTSLTAEYSMPVSDDWVATFHTDLYWQSQSFWRVFNDLNYDKLRGYSNVNLSVILNSTNGWQVMGYVKNVFNVTAITGAFLNSDDSGLTTNVFLTDPRLFGIRVTKQLDQGDGFWGSDYSGYDFFKGLFSDTDNGKPALWIELGGDYAILEDGQQTFAPPFFSSFTKPLSAPIAFQRPPGGSFDYDAKVTFSPDDTDWLFTVSVRYGRTARHNNDHQQTNPAPAPVPGIGAGHALEYPQGHYLDAFVSSNESHAIYDFTAGKDVGLGLFGLAGTSDVNGGVRFVRFNQSSGFSIHSDPDYVFNQLGPKYNHNYTATEQTKRSFHGIGPTLAWDASTPVTDDSNTGGISFDWGANGAMLFGRQIARVHHQTTGVYKCRPVIKGGCHITGTLIGNTIGAFYQTRYQRSGPAQHTRSRMVTVPNIGAFAGMSWKYQNAKVSFGYRADEFFGAMDGGIDTHRSENVGFFGPYANISIGLGG